MEFLKCKTCGKTLTADMELEYSDWHNEIFCKPDCATQFYMQQAGSRVLDEVGLRERGIKVVDNKLVRESSSLSAWSEILDGLGNMISEEYLKEIEKE